MTLCIAWKAAGEICLAADSCVTLAENSTANVCIKVLAIPCRIVEPAAADDKLRTTRYAGELGICFAGSAVNSLIIKETVAEAFSQMQYVPGYSDISLKGIADFAFTVYRHVSVQVCQTSIGKRGLADIVIAGRCPERHTPRAFRLTTDKVTNVASMIELFTDDDAPVLLGSPTAIDAARILLAKDPAPLPINVLRAVIRDRRVEGVSGAVQFGETRGASFVVSGELEYGKETVHYRRGGVDFNHADFQKPGPLIPLVRYLDFPVAEGAIGHPSASDDED